MKRIFLHRAKTEIARSNTIRNINRQIVLNYIRDRAPISRAAIAKETTLNRTTISAIVESLEADGYIEEIGIGNSSGGRRPTLFRLKTGDPATLGIDITPSLTTIALADMGGKILESEEFPTLSEMDEMTAQLIARTSEFIKRHQKADLEIGISIPGITDSPNGKVIYVPYFEWRDWDICRILKKKFNLNVTVENDANAIALAELWFGGSKIKEIKNFMTVLVADGIGTGVIFDGQIYRGEKGAAGEFGHMIVGTDAPVVCSCGSRVCWEALGSEKAALARYKQMSHKTNGSGHLLNINDLVNAAHSGEAAAIQALRETGKFIGVGISNLIVGLSPQAIVISGGIIQAWDIISEELKPFAERSVRHGLTAPLLITSTLGNHPTLMGAITLVLARKFASA